MEFGSKLEEMELTSDEISRLSKALKNETFRKMLHEYAEEISNPENKKRYEEEIKQLEMERGMDVQFVHPTPFRVIKTSDGKQKCFINICSNELIKTAECSPVSREDGRRGLNWSLPYTLAPGRPDVDANGNKHMLYDVVFHPDTLHMASKNTRFMALVDSTALDGVQKSFKVKLDGKNTKVLKTKYKGVPHATVIRTPASGQPKTHKVTDKNDPLAFPYPYDNVKASSSLNYDKSTSSDGQSTHTNSAETPKPCDSVEKPTEPHYTIKYRSVVDLQDYRYSRDSAPSPRPREVVINIDLPLLKSAADADLDVTEKQVVLKTSEPAYLLELDLAYPVDENKGQAKFNKQKRQLIVTLPVLPLKEPPVTSGNFESLSVADDDDDDEGEKLDRPIIEKETEEPLLTEDSPKILELTCVESSIEQSGLDAQDMDNAPVPNSNCLPDQKLTEEEQHSSFSNVREDFPPSADLPCVESCAENIEEESVYEQGTTQEIVDTLIADSQEELSDSIPTQGETQNTDESSMADKEQEDADSQVNIEHTGAPQQCVTDTFLISHHLKQSPTQDKAQTTCENTSEPLGCVSGEDSNKKEMITHVQVKKAVRFSERVSVALADDEDDLPDDEVQSFSGTKPMQQPAVILREMNPEDGTETIISDHTTASAFVFQNSLLYELD